MTRPTLIRLTSLVTLLTALPLASARADQEDDLQRQIDIQKAGVTDLERLDTHKAAGSDIQRLRDWLSEAWNLRSKHEPDEANVVLDRCVAQAELIRQIITASQLKAEVAQQEAKLKRTREEIEKKKKALTDMQVKRKALEPTVGS
jgi:hypothetical protein